MASFVGILIRRERMRQNLSQEGLCRGVCAVSYLSKIEQGKVSAGEDILLPLLGRLGIAYETDRTFLDRAGKLVDQVYGDVLSGKEDLPQVHELVQRIREEQARYLSSPYLLDALLLRCYFWPIWGQDAPSAVLDELGDFAPSMTRRQYEFYLLLRLHGRWSEVLETELLRLHPCGYYTTMAGSLRGRHGRYAEAIELLIRGYDLAAQEGNVHLMVLAKVYLGNCYCITGQQALMERSYALAKKLAAAVEYPHIAQDMDYNAACAYLEWGRVREAYDLLLTVQGRDDPLYCHKLALCLEKLGRPEEARAALDRASGEKAQYASIHRAMLDVVRYRLDHPDYLRDEGYARLPTDHFARLRRELPDGFARGQLPYLLELLESQRRYKEAYQLAREFSSIGAVPSI